MIFRGTIGDDVANEIDNCRARLLKRIESVLTREYPVVQIGKVQLHTIVGIVCNDRSKPKRWEANMFLNIVVSGLHRHKTVCDVKARSMRPLITTRAVPLGAV